MTGFDPRDASGVAERLRRWAATRFAGEVAVVGSPAAVGMGFDSYIHLVRLAGATLPAEWAAPLVVRLLPSADRVEQAHREAVVQAWCASHGYPAPHVLAVLDPGDVFDLPAQVMDLAPGVTGLAALKARPWRVRALIHQLAGLQLQLHAMDPAGWPGPTAADALVTQRLGLPRRVAAETGDDALAGALRRVESLLPVASAGPAVVCHGDFHPLNVMVDGASASVIDWTDAGLGPREADVARTLLLFRVASIAATGSLERTALRLIGPRLATAYRRAYERGATLDSARMRAWEALHALHGWSQVVMLHSGGFAAVSSADAGSVPAALGPWLRARFDAAIG